MICGDPRNAVGRRVLESEVMPVSAENQLRFVPVGQHDPLAQPLLQELAVEYAVRYHGTVSAVGN